MIVRRIDRHTETKTLKLYNITKSVQKIAETAELIGEGITNLEALRYFDWPDKLSYARRGRR